MLPPERNPVHIYRACLRECSYLPLPQCRSHMKKFTIDKFRNFIPKGPPGSKLPEYTPAQVAHLLKQARHHASLLKHANQGYRAPLEQVLRNTWGRVGPSKYDLLEEYMDNSSEVGHPEDQASDEVTGEDTLYPSLSPTVSTTTSPKVSTTTFIKFYEDAKAPKPSVEENPPKWKHDLPPRLSALLASQANEQPHFDRVGAAYRVKLPFSPPQRTIWKQPLPLSRYKNQRNKWYNTNVEAVLPPLRTEEDYWDLHDLVTGKKEMPPLIQRRTPPKVSKVDLERKHLEEQSDLILDGPKPHRRRKDKPQGLRHHITPRFLQRTLSRVVLSQTPLVMRAAPGTKTEANCGLVFLWDDGLSRNRRERAEGKTWGPVPGRQTELLFE